MFLVVLFAMLYGTVPFKANSMSELHKLIIKGKYELKDGVTEGNHTQIITCRGQTGAYTHSRP